MYSVNLGKCEVFKNIRIIFFLESSRLYLLIVKGKCYSKCLLVKNQQRKSHSPGFGYVSGSKPPFLIVNLAASAAAISTSSPEATSDGVRTVELSGAKAKLSVPLKLSSIGAARMSSANGIGIRCNPDGSSQPSSSRCSFCEELVFGLFSMK